MDWAVLGLFLAMVGWCHWRRLPSGRPLRPRSRPAVTDGTVSLLSAAHCLRRLCRLYHAQYGIAAYRQAADRCTGVIAALEGAQVEERP